LDRELGSDLLELAASAQEELLLVAPYVKLGALDRVLNVCRTSTTVRVVTRWRLDEIALGVSDLEVWPRLKARGGRLWLHGALHAKYYRADRDVLVGSANLTDAALGWSRAPNLEILIDGAAQRDVLELFEQALWEGASPVDDDLYEAFRAALAAFPPPPAGGVEAPAAFREWRPHLRHPEDLYRAYMGDVDALTTASREAAVLDLAALDPPPGLAKAQFQAWIGVALRQHPEVAAIDRQTEEPQRFGQLRALLANRGAEDGARAWQTWMRWLLFFLPDRYAMQVANYSEIFSRQRTGA
jgi:hypothetical protein